MQFQDIRFAVSVLALTPILCSAANSEATITYRFRSFAVCPACPTGTGGINDEGLVGAAGPTQGYVYNSRTDSSIAVPGSIAMTVPGDGGAVPGIEPTATGIAPLLRERDGTIRALAGFPGAPITAILQFHLPGDSIGWASSDSLTFFAFLRSRDGVYTKLVYPGPVGGLTLGTFLLGWNGAGTMVGYLADPTETNFEGIIRHPDGTWEPFTIPGSSATILYAINAIGALAGGYRDAKGWHGFVWLDGSLKSIDFPGAVNTTVTGMNNFGGLTGITFSTPSPLIGPSAAFVATPERGQ